MDPLRVPTEFPVVSIRNLLDFVRGKHAWDVEIFESALTVVAYGYGLASLPKAVGAALPDPAPLQTVVAEGLQAALDQHADPEVKGIGIIPWAIIIEFAISQLLKHLAK
jgi:hypothetical protein